MVHNGQRIQKNSKSLLNGSEKDFGDCIKSVSFHIIKVDDITPVILPTEKGSYRQKVI